MVSELRTVSSALARGKRVKISFLKASTPDLNLGDNIGIKPFPLWSAHKEK